MKSANKKTDIQFSDTELFHYFSNLLNVDTEYLSTLGTTEIEDSDLSLETETQMLIDETLNHAITFDEVKQMVKQLKSGKASGLDMLGAELLKHVKTISSCMFSQNFSTSY